MGCSCGSCDTVSHPSDCAVHNAPALPKGRCSCEAPALMRAATLSAVAMAIRIRDEIRENIRLADGLLPKERERVLRQGHEELIETLTEAIAGAQATLSRLAKEKYA